MQNTTIKIKIGEKMYITDGVVIKWENSDGFLYVNQLAKPIQNKIRMKIKNEFFDNRGF
jgi:hypothetical protein